MGRRTPFLPAAVLGNGQLLVTLSARGEVERIFWPHVDGPQQMQELRLAVSLGSGPTRPLDEAPFTWEQQYHDDAMILRTRVGHGGRAVEVLDLVAVDDSVLARRLRVGSGGGSVVVSCRPSLGGSEAFNAGYVDPSTGALVCYGRGAALAVLSDPGPAKAGVWRADGGEPDAIEHRWPIAGELIAPPGVETALYAALGATPREALARVTAAREAGFAALLERRVRHDRHVLAAAAPPVAEDGLYRRSLLVLDTLADRATGAVIASPECDPGFLHSGGYGFVWPRDFSFVLLALLAAGHAEPAATGLRWLARAQAPEGLWLQRYWTDGSPAPAWSPHQLDETGIVLFACEAAWRELADETLDHDLWPSARAGATFLAGFLDEETGLLLPSVDLWEQDDAQHAYTSAAAAGGLRAAALMAERHEPGLAEGWRGAADAIASGIDETLWSEREGRYLRAALVGRADRLGEPVPRQFRERPAFPARAVHSVQPLDHRLDSALLGLAWPFAAVDPASSRMAATAAAIEQGLAAPGGGLLRHEADTYRGGNAWPLCTLWLGLYRRLVGDEDGLRAALEWTRSRATQLGLLPEQTHADGTPAWALPLGWSHAMLVLAVRPELSLIAELAADVSGRATSRL